MQQSFDDDDESMELTETGTQLTSNLEVNETSENISRIDHVEESDNEMEMTKVNGIILNNTTNNNAAVEEGNDSEIAMDMTIISSNIKQDSEINQIIPTIHYSSSFLQSLEQEDASSSKNNTNPIVPQLNRHLSIVEEEEEDNEDYMTMDVTRIGGSINKVSNDEEESNMTMDITKVGGSIKHVNGEEEDDDDNMTMDITKVGGSIKHVNDEEEEEEDDDDDDMTMDITRVGGIINQTNHEDDNDAEEMDITKPLGNIKSIVGENEEESMMEVTMALGSITNSNKNSQNENDSESESDMDMTMNVTRAVSSINTSNNDKSIEMETTMDVTKAISSIKTNYVSNDEDDEDMDMDMTTVLTPSKVSSNKRPSPTNIQNSNNKKQKLSESPSRESRSPRKSRSPKKISSPESPTSRRKSRLSRLSMMSSNRPINVLKDLKTENYLQPESNSKLKTNSNTNTPSKKTRSKSKSPKRSPLKNISPFITNQRTPQKDNKFKDNETIQDRISALTPKKSQSLQLPSNLQVYDVQLTPTISTPPHLTEDDVAAFTPLRSVKKVQLERLYTPSLNTVTEKIKLAPLDDDDDEISDNNNNNRVVSNYVPVSLNTFLDSIGAQFYDDLEVSEGVSSSILGNSNNKEKPNLIDYSNAIQQLPLLEMFEFGCNELKKNLKDGKKNFNKLEEETLEENPLLIKEYFQSTNSARIIMNGQFMMIKNYSRQQAKMVWYNWRTQLVDGILIAINKNEELLKNDEIKLNEFEDKIGKNFKILKDKNKELKLKLSKLKLLKEQYKNININELIKIRKDFIKIKEELLLQQIILNKNEKIHNDLKNKIGNYKEKIENLKFKIKESELIYEKNKIYKLNDILKMKLKNDLLSSITGLIFKNLNNDKSIDYLFEGLIISISLEKNPKILDLKLDNENENQSIPLQFFASKLLGFIPVGITCDEQIKKIQNIWRHAILIDKEIKDLSLIYKINIKIDSNDNKLKISMIIFNQF